MLKQPLQYFKISRDLNILSNPRVNINVINFEIGIQLFLKMIAASGSKSISSKDLRSSLFNFTEKTGKSINLI